jgi:glyoxylase-like metal-dependent hydrolase (beta-lactamase superfamily II)
MKIADGIESLEIPMDFMGSGGGVINPVVAWDEREGATLFDAGLPGQLPAIEEGLGKLGLRLSSVKRLFLTHQDLDHIGSAQAIVEAVQPGVYAHTADVPFIQGELPLLKMDPKRFEARMAALPAERRAQAMKLLSSPPRVKVSHPLEGGEELPFHGGIVVIPTPGHTPGHVSYYLKAHKVLVAGDALRVEGGSLIGPAPMATPDMRRAVASLHNLLPWRIDAVICYHGGLVKRDIATRLAALTRIST